MGYYIAFLILYSWFGVGLMCAILWLRVNLRYLLALIVLALWFIGLIYIRGEFFSSYLG